MESRSPDSKYCPFITSLRVPQSAVKEKALYIFKILLTLLVMYILIINVDSSAMINSFYHANYGLLAAAVLLGILNIFLQFSKWKLICTSSLNETENKKVWHSLLFGIAGALITPFRLGEYAGRSLGLRNNDIIKVTVGTLADHFFSMIIILLAGSGAVLISLRLLAYISSPVLILLIVFIILLAILVRWLLINAGKLKAKTFTELKNIKMLKIFITSAESFGGLSVNLRFRLLLLSFFAFICYTAQYGLIVAALSNQWLIHLYFLTGILTIFTKTIIPPFTLGDLGIREGASVFFITQIGLSAAIGLNASLLLFFLNIAIPSLIGSYLLLKRN